MDTPIIFSQIGVMQQQERSASYRITDYISRPNSAVTPSDREALCNWGYRIIAACDSAKSRSAVVVAISYFDRFLSSRTPMANRALSDTYYFQLAFVTSLVIALKVHAGFNVEHDFVGSVFCRNNYETEEITQMEIRIIQALRWKMSGPNAHDFIDYFLEVTPGIDGSYKEFVTKFSKDLVELAVIRYNVAVQYPSVIAFTAIRCTLHLYCIDLLTRSSSLSFLETISGVRNPWNDIVLVSLFETMFELVEEVCIQSDSRAADYLQQDDMNSMSTESSPISIMRGN